ncbi:MULTISPECIES: hypothetical protein [Bacillus cereus group]|jgi:ribosomal protein L15|uniref:Uncharacterized protein n=1 Tax=Bacillus mycoides TaxID=1405 RepID=A0A4U2ZYN4_BACMY|nr:MULTISPECIES: hypothetical protein [Bacillus cereus group]EJP82039.1 hypothetical protein IC3_05724 [Bacillus cereus VD142]MDX5828943.1 hypothetical protein [Bacillus cereus group sp. BfR-BA-02147]TKI79812.1 hypothetical protein FC701_30425 [Bacillus mycoides]
MDIHIRNVDPYYVKEIDKRCKQIGAKLGRRYYRSEYINDLLEKHFEQEYRRNKEDKFDEAIGNVTVTLERQEDKLQEYIDATNELVKVLGQGR